VFRHPKSGIPALAVLCALAFTSGAHALERVNLTTGFSYDCVRHEAAEDASHVRLFLYSPDGATSDNNFILIPADKIASVDMLPDPPKPQPVLATAPVSTSTLSAMPAMHDLLSKAGAQHNIDVELLASIVKAESGGNTHAVSRTGARGLMQLMPGTARELGVDDVFRPDQNINAGAKYLDALLTLYRNDLSLALAAYNAGPAAVDRYHGIPPYRETRAYIARVEKEFIRRTAAAKQAAKQASPQTNLVAAAILP
jgi:soluble lytic murein transglycosylase-like protein